MFRTILTILITAILAGTAGWFAATRQHHASHAAQPPTGGSARKIRLYQSPMHPWITSDKPGKCTICGMALAPVYEGESGFDGGQGRDRQQNLVTLPASSAAVIGVQTSEIARGPLARTLRLTGTIEADESSQKLISSYTDARIESIQISTTGVTVAADQPLATLYSPELLTARQEYHAIVKTTPGSPLAAIAREKLRRLGLLDSQIDALAQAQGVSRDTEILAPLSGIVIARAESAYVGAYVKAGDPLVTIVDFSTMWALLDIYEPDLALLSSKSGISNPPPLTLTTPAIPGRNWSAPISYIDASLNPDTRTARARIELPNTDQALRRGQTIFATLTATLSTDALLIPRSAVLFTHGHPIAWVLKPGTASNYEPRALQLGQTGDVNYEVLSGLLPGEHVVTKGALLIDGQAQISGISIPSLPLSTGASQAKPAPAPNVPPPSSTLIHAAADAAEALAADNLAAYQKIAATIPELSSSAASATNLKEARAAFEHFSTTLAAQVQKYPLPDRQKLGIRIYQCPMTPELGTGRWLQRASVTGIRNPFFGSDMLECGEEIRAEN